MTTLKFILILLLIVPYSCKQNPAKHKVKPSAVELNNKAMTLIKFIDNPDSSKKAIALLEKATAIESNYFLSHYNKLMFYNQLKQFGKAVSTVNRLIQLRPSAHDLYLTGGILQERNGDGIAARPYFEKSLTICNRVLDTMSSNSKDYEMLVSNKAINLIMLGDTAKANATFKKLYGKKTDGEMIKLILSMMNKNRTELIKQFSDNKCSH